VIEKSNSPGNVYIYSRKDSIEAGEQLVAWNARNLWWRHECYVDDVSGLIVSAEYNAQTTLSGVPVMVMACVNPMAINM